MVVDKAAGRCTCLGELRPLRVWRPPTAILVLFLRRGRRICSPTRSAETRWLWASKPELLSAPRRSAPVERRAQARSFEQAKAARGSCPAASRARHERRPHPIQSSGFERSHIAESAAVSTDEGRRSRPVVAVQPRVVCGSLRSRTRPCGLNRRWFIKIMRFIREMWYRINASRPIYIDTQRTHLF